MKHQIPQLLLIIYLYTRITINMISYSFFSNENIFQSIKQNFNDYAIKNNLNITLNINLFSSKNSTQNINNFHSSIETLIDKKSDKYDLFTFDPIYIRNLYPYFIDLKEWLPSEYIDWFSLNNIDKICTYENKWIGLPLFIKFMILYSNNYYLEKYNKKIPKTWDKLLEIGQDIIEQEKINNNNTNLYGYNGLFSYDKEDLTSSFCSIYQTLYSYRDNRNSAFPEIKSQNSINALKKIKEIKEKISLDEIFKENGEYSIKLLNEGNSLIFAVFWNLENEFKMFNKSMLPGRTEDITGSCIGGYNIGVNSYIDDDHKLASIEVLKFFFSKEFQKEIIIKQYNEYSGIIDLYKNKEVCSILNCELINNNQFINRPTTIKNYKRYEYKFLNYFYEFLYEKKSEKETLQNIENLTKIYYLNLNDSILVIASYILSRIPKFKSYYSLYSTLMWVNYIFSSIFIIYSPLMKFGKPTKFKCNAFILMLLIGYSMLYVPSFCSLIVNTSEIKNKFLNWIKNNERTFIVLICIFEVILITLSAIYPSEKPVEIITEDSINFYQCQLNKKNLKGVTILIINILIHCLLYIFFIIFMLKKLNNNPIRGVIKNMLYFSSIDGISIFLHIYLYYIRIWFDNANNKKEKEEKIINDLLKMNNETTIDNSLINGKTIIINTNDQESISKSQFNENNITLNINC
ncbi:hypothetical protein H8356DRAFT_1279713 [Neocallimastix lanati (nom. inval.)]|nr:hypothetical protein H8356DRAFT_1279713 [Neocallimastix sp. JGI-2020a]